MIKIVSTQQLGMSHGVKVLLYGKSGTGKTFQAQTCPAPIVISVESGMMTLRNVNLPAIKVTNVIELNEVYNWALQSKDARQFQTIYIDSISEVGEVVLANAKLQVKDPRQAYGELIEKMLMTIKAFRDLPGYHVVMTAKQEAIKDDVTGVVSYGPSMPGSKLGPQLPYLFDEVFRIGIGKFAKGEEFRFIQTMPDFQHDAKDRSGRLRQMEEANLGMLISKIYS